MRLGKTVKATNRLKLKMISKNQGLKADLLNIIYHSELKIFFLRYFNIQKPVRTLDLKSHRTLIFEIAQEKGIYDIQLSKDQQRLLFVGKDQFLYIVELLPRKQNRVFKKFKLPCRNIYSFMFADKYCEKVFLTSNVSGLYLMNLKTGFIQQLYVTGFDSVWSQTNLISANLRVLYGCRKNRFSASYFVSRGFKFRVFSFNIKGLDNTCNALSEDNKMLFSGNRYGKLVIIDTRSSKLLTLMQFSSDCNIYTLRSKGRFLYGGTWGGELFVLQACFSFRVFYFCKISSSIDSICVTDHLLIVGGRKYDPIRVFSLPK